MFRGATIFHYSDPLTSREIKIKLKKSTSIENLIDDKNTDRERNLVTIIRDVSEKQGRVLGVIDYYFQARVSKQVKYADIFDTFAFIISPSDNILVVLGKSANADKARNQISKCLYGDKSEEIQYFEPIIIKPDSMLEIALVVRDSHEKNWCDRPRFSHIRTRRTPHVFHDYSDGPGNCVLETKEFKSEFGDCIGFSPIIKYKKCSYLDPNETRTSKTIRFKHEGQISTSTSHEFEYWEFFIFDCMLKIMKNHNS